MQRLLWLRSVMIGIEGAAIWIATAVLHIAFDWPSMVVILALLALVTAHTWLRIQRGAQVSELELFCQLLVDVGTLTALLYLSGGSANPFVSLYLLPLVIAATTLPGQYAWTMAGATALCYALLFFFYVPLPSLQQDHTAHGFALHLSGMWINFVVSAVVISLVRCADGRGDPAPGRAVGAPSGERVAKRTDRGAGDLSCGRST